MNLQYNDLYNFFGIVGDIVSHPEFLKLRFEKHHGSNRYDHSLRVAIKTYKFAIKHKLDVVEVTRASLLHDFFFNKDFGSNEQLYKLRSHPMMSVVNSKIHFHINQNQEDIIKTHMFPITREVPKSNAAKNPNPIGTITPSIVMTKEATPVCLICFKSVSIPALNIIRITPISATICIPIIELFVITYS